MLVSLGAVSAANVNDTAEEQVLSESVDVDTISASITINEDNNTQESINNENLLSAGTDGSGNDNNVNILSASNTEKTLLGDDNYKTFTDFYKLYRLSSSSMTLYYDYKYNSDEDTDYTDGFTIDKTITIDGNGHTIDANNLIHVFKVTADNVILKNIKIVNTYTSDSDYASILWLGDNGQIINSSFIKSSNANYVSTSSDYEYSGCIKWMGDDGLITDCYFESCSNGGYYGYNAASCVLTSSDSLNINNTIFYKSSNCEAIVATMAARNPVANNCTFTQCTGKAGIIFTRRAQLELNDCNFISCYGTSYIIFNRGYMTLNGCYFTGNTGPYILLDAMTVTNCTFENNKQNNQIHSTVFGADGTNFIDCKFIGGTKGLLSSDARGINIINCTFQDITSSDNYIIYGSPTLFTMENCSFINCKNSNTGNALIRIAGGSRDTFNNVTFTGCQNNKFSFASSSISVNNDTIAGQYYDFTWLNNFTAYPVLYAAEGAIGNGTEDNPCNLTFALNNLDYDGTIYVKAGTYNEWSKDTSYILYGSMIGYGGKVLTNNLTFAFKSIGGSVENIIFNDSNMGFGILTNNKMINVTVSNSSTSSNILDYVYAQGAKNFQLINCTLDNITASRLNGDTNFVTANIINLTVKNSNFTSYFLYLQDLNHNQFNNIHFTNTSLTSFLYSFNTNLKMFSMDDIEFVNCTVRNELIHVNNDVYGTCVINDLTLKNTNLTSNVDYLFMVNYNAELSDINIDNITGKGNITDLFSFSYDDNSIIGLTLNNLNATNLITSANSYVLEDVSVSNIVANNSFSVFTDMTFKNMNIYDSNFTSGVVLNLTDNNALVDSSVTNVTGHIIVNGSRVKVTNSEFKNNNNSLLNGSVFEVLGTGSYFTVNNCNFTNNTGLYGGAVYIHQGAKRTSFKNTNFTANNATGPELDWNETSGTYNYGTNNSRGGAIKFEHVVGSGFVVTIDEFTNSTINQTSRYYNNIAGNISSLVGDYVYVVNNVSNWTGSDGKLGSGSARTWEDAGTFETAFSLAGDGCTLIFVRYGDLFNYTGSSLAGQLVPDVLPIEMSDNLTFQGNGTTITNLRFHVPENITLTAYNITFKDNAKGAVIVDGYDVLFEDCQFIDNGGDDADYGAAIIINGNTVIRNCNFTNNNVYGVDGGYGGALYVNSSSIAIDNCTFSLNGAALNGNHLYVEAGYQDINITGSRFNNGTRYSDASVASGVVVQGSNLEITYCNFTNNTGNTGGSVSLIGDIVNLNFNNNNFTNNTAVNGNLFMEFTNTLGGTNNIVSNTFNGNEATNGGGIFLNTTSTTGLTWTNTVFESNNATNGGALYVNASFSLSDITFKNNNATYGGALYVNASGVSVSDSNFTSNNAVFGGAAYINSNGTVFNTCNFTANTALASNSYGSALYVADNTDVTITSSLFDKNSVYDGVTSNRADISYDGILPSISADTVLKDNTDDGLYQQYAHNRTDVTVYYDMVYVSLTDRGQGYSNLTATTMDKALEGIRDNGIIIICDDEYTWTAELLTKLTEKNLTNVTFQGLTSKTSIKRNSDQNEKYLFILGSI